MERFSKEEISHGKEKKEIKMEELEIRNNFAKNLTKLRKYNKLSQQELAKKLSYSDKAISKWELGDNIPDIITLHKVAELFNVSVDELISPNVSISKSAVTKKNRIIITAISSGAAALLGLIALLVLMILKNNAGIDSQIMKTFIYCCYPFAFLGASIVLIVMTSLWFEKIWILLSVSVCIWSSAIIAMIWMDFQSFWIVVLIAFVLNILFGIFLKIEK